MRVAKNREVKEAFERNPSLPEFDSYCGLVDFAIIYGAFLDGKLIGYLAQCEDELMSFYVCPEHRGKGIGNMLLEKYGHACTEVMVWRDNPIALRLYRKYGFVNELQSTENILLLGKL